ncbi:MAG TPA: hypothetical protein DCW74_12045 [Alteromonas australica]|uniref:DUF1289 domain-containing protein n=1 Tax=Alteromonas australica TaxID=589873 RepID=A0A350P584_9ALTE|nr:hypothetical protein [Alteromonas australica]
MTLTLDGDVESMLDAPCIGWCTTRQFGDDRCKGCGRQEWEVRDWSRLPDIYRRLRIISLAEEGFTIRHVQPLGWRPTPGKDIEDK